MFLSIVWQDIAVLKSAIPGMSALRIENAKVKLKMNFNFNFKDSPHRQASQSADAQSHAIAATLSESAIERSPGARSGSTSANLQHQFPVCDLFGFLARAAIRNEAVLQAE
jgi:hypothetical protein